MKSKNTKQESKSLYQTYSLIPSDMQELKDFALSRTPFSTMTYAQVISYVVWYFQQEMEQAKEAEAEEQENE